MTGTDDRAVSEVLSFALVFAIITTSVALAFVLGFPALEDERNAERVTNAERAFDILADNMEDIYKRGAPSRVTEIKLSDAQLAVVEEQQVKVTVKFADNGTEAENQTSSYRPIIYQSGESKLSYANGGIVRVDRESAIMKREPALLFEQDRTVLPTVQTRSRNVQSVGSSSTAILRATLSESEVLTERRDYSAGYTVTYEFTAATQRQAAVWEQYLEGEIDWRSDACTVNDTLVECTFDTDEVYFSVSRIDVELS